MYAVNIRDTGHIGIRAWVYVHVQTIIDVIPIKPKSLALMGYHIFLTMALHARVELRY